MAGLKFSSFGAATMPLSKIVVDGDLHLAPYDATAENLIAKTVKGAYDPSNWQTISLPWPDDTTPSVLISGQVAPDTIPTLTWVNGESKPVEVYAEITNTGSATTSGYVYIDGVQIYYQPGIVRGATYVFPPMWVAPAATVTLRNANGTGFSTGVIHDTGRRGTPQTFVLTDEWLALGIDLLGMTGTISILGETISYDDYILYFPLKPSTITISGTMTPTQNRPIILGYK